MTPVFISSRNRHVAVFGGGRVALRKCLHFKGFSISVTAESILPGIRDLASEVHEEKLTAESASARMAGADIVIAATDDRGLNDSIRDLAESRGIPVNSAHGGGDLLIPSTLRRKGYTVTVSTEGRAPAFPPYVIDRIDGFLGDDYDAMLDLMIRLRTEIRDTIPTQPGRAAFLAEVLNDGTVWELLRGDDPESAYTRAMGMMP